MKLHHITRSVTKQNSAIALLAVLLLVGATAFALQSRNTATTRPGDQPTATNNANPASGAASDKNPATPGTPPSAADQPPGATNAKSSVSSSVTISADGFSPNTATVKKGLPVTWTNKDTTAHALDPADGSDNGPHSPQLNPGESYIYTFTKLGTYKYIDVLNPTLGGTITVID